LRLCPDVPYSGILYRCAGYNLLQMYRQYRLTHMSSSSSDSSSDFLSPGSPHAIDSTMLAKPSCRNLQCEQRGMPKTSSRYPFEQSSALFDWRQALQSRRCSLHCVDGPLAFHTVIWLLQRCKGLACVRYSEQVRSANSGNNNMFQLASGNVNALSAAWRQRDEQIPAYAAKLHQVIMAV
jgi:hypothetical protein